MIRNILIALATAAALCTSAFAAIDVNKASAAELEAVRGVGPKLSATIVDERSKGAFKSWDDLIQRVRGVGPGSAAKLSANGMTVGNAPYTGSEVAKPTPESKPAAPVKPAAK